MLVITSIRLNKSEILRLEQAAQAVNIGSSDEWVSGSNDIALHVLGNEQIPLGSTLLSLKQLHKIVLIQRYVHGNREYYYVS